MTQKRLFAPLMPKNILVDLNVILDVLLKRPGHEASQSVLQLQEMAGHNVYISGHVVTTMAYLLEHAKVPRPEIKRQIGWLLQKFTVVATNENILQKATKSRVKDYEDAVIEQAAAACGARVIVTRNIKDFKNSAVKANRPEAIIASL